MEQALLQLISAHPAFNIHFETQGNDVVQVYDPDLVPVVTRSEMTEKDLIAYQQSFVLPFNLDRGPLYRMEIVQTENRVVILIDVHHLIFDGASRDSAYSSSRRGSDRLRVVKNIRKPRPILPK